MNGSGLLLKLSWIYVHTSMRVCWLLDHSSWWQKPHLSAFAHIVSLWELPWFLQFQCGSLSSLRPNQVCPSCLQRTKLSSPADICFTAAFWNYCILLFFCLSQNKKQCVKSFLRQCYLVSMFTSVITKKNYVPGLITHVWDAMKNKIKNS